MTALRVIFMGSPDFALPTLRALLASHHRVVAAYSQPPRPAGRGQKLTPTPVAELAASQQLPVLTPTSLKTPEAQAKFAAFKADIAVVAAYGLLLPPTILAATRYGCINIHPSSLPRWRGAAPIQRTLMAGDSTTQCCLMQMAAGLDTGDVLMRRDFAIPENMDGGALHDAMAALGATMTLDYLDQLAAGAPPKPVAQAEHGATYAAKLTAEDAAIDWTKPAEEIRNQMRGLAPTPGAFTMLAGERVKIFAAEIAPGTSSAKPGTVLSNLPLTIQCGDGKALHLRELQRPGKRRAAAEEAIKSMAIQVGSVVSSRET
jgi:methionyl-tRNA formyltransferase